MIKLLLSFECNVASVLYPWTYLSCTTLAIGYIGKRVQNYYNFLTLTSFSVIIFAFSPKYVVFGAEKLGLVATFTSEIFGGMA